VSQPIQDEGFHEIQLNGKQLVFLFIAATVVSVVIFLCGVLVGRGVRAGQVVIADASQSNPGADTSPQQPASAPVPPPAGTDPTTAAAPPPPAADDLSYFDRLQKPKSPAEQLKAAPKAQAVERPAPPPPREVPPPPAAKEPAAAPAPAPLPVQAPVVDPARPEASGQGFAVQIAALNVRSEADAIAKRLSSKGYAAYVLAPADGTPSVYRVRVGKFPTRREAESIAARLQKEEQFKPWVTR